MNKEVLLFVDDEFAYGVKKGFFNDLSFLKNSDFRSVQVLGLSEADEFNLKPMENDMYVYNPYDLNYLLVDNNLNQKFLEAKLFKYPIALGYMGATEVHGLIDTASTERFDFKNTTNGKVEKSKITVRGDLQTTAQITEKLKKHLSLESNFGRKKTSSLKEVERYITNHGLQNDAVIKHVFERFRNDQNLHGEIKYETSFATELNAKLDLAASLGISSVFELKSETKMGYSYQSEISFSINIVF